jgi:hypothetical protein
VAACGFAGRLTSSSSGCVWTKGQRGGTRKITAGRPPLVAVPYIAERFISEFWLPYQSIKQQNTKHLKSPSSISRGSSFEHFFMAVYGWSLPNFSIADLSLIFERYFYFNLLVIGTALILNKEQPWFSEFAHLNVNVFHYILWVLFNIKILHLALHWGGIRC